MPHRQIYFQGMRAVLVMTVFICTLLVVSPVWAHPPDMYFHVLTVHVSPQGIQVTWAVTPGPMLAYKVWNEADTDQDGSISPDEARAWAQPSLPDLVLDNGATLTWNLESVEWPAVLADFEAGTQPIQIELTSGWPGTLRGDHRFILYNSYQEASSVNWFYLYGDEGLTFPTPEQHNGQLQFDLIIPADGSSVQPAADLTRVAYWDSGTPSLSGGGGTPNQAPIRRPSSALIRLVRTTHLSPGFYLTALAIALGLGALHALTPGHGKTLVGAYLVGSRGTTRHAIALGSIVTLTHTGSVLGLGLLTLVASHIIMPTVIFPILEIVSGLLVVVLGVFILRRRWRGYQAVRIARRRRRRQAHRQALESGRGQTIQINQAITVNVYNDVLPGADVSLSGINWRSLVGLGVSGGLIPCPDAIAILLVAVAINRLWLGLMLIVAFSMGLALVLTGIGIMIVRSRRLLEGLNAVDRMAPAIPMLSAVVVIGLGLGLTVNAARSAQKSLSLPNTSEPIRLAAETSDSASFGKPMLRPVAPFEVQQARVLYINIDSANYNQLFVYDRSNDTSVPLTQEPSGIWDYALSPDGTTIAYTMPQTDGSELWAMSTDGTHRRQLLTCPQADCTRAVWSPDGRILMYERRDAPLDAPVGVPSIWQLDLSSGDTEPIFQDSQLLSYDPQWSFDGQWLSFMSANSLQVQIRNLSDGRSRSVAEQSGRSIVWSPVGGAFLMIDLVTQADGQPYTHLLRYDVDNDQTVDLTGMDGMGDTWSSWSPDGKWVAVVRTDTASNGDQVWVMRADGSEARQLTTAPDVVHEQPVWSPDGHYLIFQEYLLSQSTAVGPLWLLNVETQELQELIPAGSWPIWLPEG
jgi:ABC-type nickel/cobalt efflux system permease component RcnA/Tol biopolymer transport system component